MASLRQDKNDRKPVAISEKPAFLRTKMRMTYHGRNHSYCESCTEKKDSPDKSAKHRRREK